MKTIKYNNKTYKIPEPFSKNIDMEQALTMGTHTNPYSNQSCQLPDFAGTIYYNIKDAEWAEQYDVVRKGLDWFRKYFAKEYMVLLD
tara:strand:- start:468 stop:728 length:261 start_codon:yes stop_codon:yes gene_type:complete